ncbi:MAG: winged helix-turn-helix domain-containing protein [Acidobacteriota bacterium]
MEPATVRFYEFGPFRIDAAKRLLLREGEMVPLAPKAFDTLLVLVRHQGQVLEKDELMEMLWPDSDVEEANLPLNISALRKALGESPSERRYIVTIPGRGYRFAADVKETVAEEAELIVERHKQSTLLIREREEDSEDRPDKDQKLLPAASPSLTKWLWAALAAVAIVALAAGVYLLFRGIEEPRPRVAIKSLAVLPFKPLVEDGDEYLGIGMTDVLITRLSSLRGVTVSPTSAVLKYASPGKETVEIGRELGVESVLEGSIHRSGERIRVTVRLLSVRDGTPMWADKFDEKFTDIFTVEDSISERVAERLAMKLNSAEREVLAKRDTQNTEAHLLYLKGRYQMEKRTPEALKKGIEFFTQATEKDSSYALAYAEIAGSYHSLSITGHMHPGEAFPRVKEMAAKALDIDPLLAEAHTFAGVSKYFHDWDWSGAERDFKRAIEINPNSAYAHFMYGHLLSNLGRHREALAEGSRALELDPLSLILNALRGQMLFYAGQYDDAIAHLQKAIDMEPNFWVAHLVLGKVYERKKMYAEALAEFQRAGEMSGGSPEPKSYLAYTYAVSGRRAQTRQMIDELKEMSIRQYVPPKHIALVYAGLGEKDEMFEWLEKAYEDRDISLTFIKVEPRWDPYRADPRFENLMKRVGFSQ